MSKTAKTQTIDADSRDYDLKDIENDPERKSEYGNTAA